MVILVSSAAGAAGGIVTDGFWWDALPNGAKANVMTGATAAYEAGWRDGLLAGESVGASVISRAAQTDQKATSLQTLRTGSAAAIAGQASAFDGRPIAEYVSRMDEFYVKHSDVSDLDFAAVLACIQDKPSRTCDAVAADYVKSKAAPLP